MHHIALSKPQALLLFFILLSTMLPAQKVGPIWLDRDYDVVEDSLHAESYRLVIPMAGDSLILLEEYTLAGQILKRGQFLLIDEAPDWLAFDFSFAWDSSIFRHGRFMEWDHQGRIQSFKDFNQGNQTSKIYYKQFFSPKASIEVYGIRNYELNDPFAIIKYKTPEENMNITLEVPSDYSDAKDSVWMSKNGSPFWLERIIEFDGSKAPVHFAITGFYPSGRIAYQEKWGPVETDYKLKYRFTYSGEESPPDIFYSVHAARQDTAWYFHESGKIKSVNIFSKENSERKKPNKKREFSKTIPNKKENKRSTSKILCKYKIDGPIHLISLNPGETVSTFFENHKGGEAQVKSTTQLHHDWRFMSYREYHANGQLKVEGKMMLLKSESIRSEPYNMFIKNGLWTYWDSLGQVTSIATWVGNFQSLSHLRTYYPNGLKEKEKLWNVTELNGAARLSFNSERSWYQNGNLKEEWLIHNSQETYKKWTIDGTLLTYYSYKNGRKHGLQYRYTPLGEVLASLRYENGKWVE